MRYFTALLLVATGVGVTLGAGAWLEAGRRTPAGAARAAAGAAPVPVVACAATRADVPVDRSGIGSVRAAAQVAVVARVEGELQQLLVAEGRDVEAGAVIARIDPARYAIALRQADAAMTRDKARLNLAQAELRRNAELAQRGATAEAAVEAKRSLVTQIEAEIENSAAMRDRAAIDLELSQVRAPIAGRIGLRTVDAGTYLRPGDGRVIATITQVNPVTVIFSLPERDLAVVRAAMAHGKPLPVTAYGSDLPSGTPSGRLVTIESQTDPKTGTFRLKALFDAPDGSLWPGQFVNARVSLGVNRNQVVVPAHAVERGPQGAYVYVVGPDRRALRRRVVTGPQLDGLVVIESGLGGQEQVVVDGQYQLDEGRIVVLVASPTETCPATAPAS